MASVFPKPNMDYIGRVLSDLLSRQYGEEIVVRFIPKEKTEEGEAAKQQQ